MKRFLTPLLPVLFCAQICGCAAVALAPYDLYEDKRDLETIADDSKIKSRISNELSDAGFSDDWNTSVFCYNGRVFIVGAVPPRMREKAFEIAHATPGVVSVDHFWFTPAKSRDGDLAVSAKLRANLISADDLVSSRVDTVVDAGRVVLLGIVGGEREKDAAVSAARGTSGVKEVHSLLIVR